MIRLANPIASQYPVLRCRILPGLLDALRRNASRGLRDLALYETGSVFLAKDEFGTAQLPALGRHPGDDVIAQLDAGIPDQPQHLAVALAYREPAAQPGEQGRARDWADAVEAARKAADLLHVELGVVQGSHQAFHPGRTAELKLAERTVGYAGELHPKVIEEWICPRAPA